MSDHGKFEDWANEFDPDSDQWEDMGRDQVFIAGLHAGRAECQPTMPDEAREAIRRLKAFIIVNHGADTKVLRQVNDLLSAVPNPLYADEQPGKA
ncbi:hypothetical protein [Marinobacter salicampi]|uniref:hypothetical protein n=1 Tax=Marinobacter salicampi TaxID=435907 RepID=UPI0014073F7E|nr:hypothetical protein [Marinobacter salicampi]